MDDQHYLATRDFWDLLFAAKMALPMGHSAADKGHPGFCYLFCLIPTCTPRTTQAPGGSGGGLGPAQWVLVRTQVYERVRSPV